MEVDETISMSRLESESSAHCWQWGNCLWVRIEILELVFRRALDTGCRSPADGQRGYAVTNVQDAESHLTQNFSIFTAFENVVRKQLQRTRRR